MKDEFGNYTGRNPKPSWRKRNEYRIDAFKFWWLAWWPAIIGAIMAALAISWVYRMATRPPAAAITLNRSEWACTQTARELAYITPQGIPINQTTCLQWSRQP